MFYYSYSNDKTKIPDVTKESDFVLLFNIIVDFCLVKPSHTFPLNFCKYYCHIHKYLNITFWFYYVCVTIVSMFQGWLYTYVYMILSLVLDNQLGH